LLSGQLGSAQLGAAELGGFQTVTTGAGFPIFFPDVGPAKTAEPPKKKKPKKVKAKKPKKPKRVKVKASITLPTPAPVCVTETTLPEPAPVLGSAVALAIQEELYRQERLRETIAEEDELLLLIC
jgi:hypothetical protein